MLRMSRASTWGGTLSLVLGLGCWIGAATDTRAADGVLHGLGKLNTKLKKEFAEIHKLDDVDMNRTDFDPRSPKHRAALRIHLLGYLLHMLVELDG